MTKDRHISGSLEPTPEAKRVFTWERCALFVEWGFGVAIVLAILQLVQDVRIGGYLPDPFLHAKPDSFNDWYNPAYWANNHGAYTEWSSIYPPFCFVLLRLFTRAKCYAFGVDYSRECDPAGIILISVFTIVNFILAWVIYHKVDKRTALPRALAVGAGFPVLYAWERGNLIVPCFTAFMLAYGNILKSARLRTFFAAVSLNIKPYLILAFAGQFVKRDWTRLEWSALWFIAIYAASFAIIGAGDPLTLIANTMNFEHTPGIDLIAFTTTYAATLTIVKLPLPVMDVLGSKPIEAAEFYLPILMNVGAAGVIACVGYAFLRPATFTRVRVSALALLLIMTMSTAPGGYSLEYALFFVFFEKWSGPGRIFVLTCAYVWCVPIDVPVLVIYPDYGFSFLGQRAVQYDLSLTLGQLVRPGLLLLIQYGLICVSIGEIVRDIRGMGRQRRSVALA